MKTTTLEYVDSKIREHENIIKEQKKELEKMTDVYHALGGQMIEKGWELKIDAFNKQFGLFFPSNTEGDIHREPDNMKRFLRSKGFDERVKGLHFNECSLYKIPERITAYMHRDPTRDGTFGNHIERLCLANNDIKEIQGCVISKLRNLVSLDLSRNKLTELPPEMCALDKLKLLDIRGNNFYESVIREIKCMLPESCTILFTKDNKSYMLEQNEKTIYSGGRYTPSHIKELSF